MAEPVTAVAAGRTVIAARSSAALPTVPAEPTGNRGPAGAPRAPGAAAGPSSRLRTGRYGEELAATYLEDIGWKVLERNWRPEHGLRGELDIIALEPAPGGREPGDESIGSEQMTRTSVRSTLVVVEVKTRSSLRQGPPAAAVDPRKLARLRALTAAWVATHEAPRAGLRLDVISILLRDARPALLRHHRAVGTSWG